MLVDGQPGLWALCSWCNFVIGWPAPYFGLVFSVPKQNKHVTHAQSGTDAIVHPVVLLARWVKAIMV